MLRNIFSAKDRAHAGHRARRIDGNALYSRVRARAAHERSVQGSRRQHVVDVAARAGDEALRFFSSDSFSDGRMAGKIHDSYEGAINRARTDRALLHLELSVFTNRFVVIHQEGDAYLSVITI